MSKDENEVRLKLTKEQRDVLSRELGIDAEELYLGVENVKVLTVRTPKSMDVSRVAGAVAN